MASVVSLVVFRPQSAGGSHAPADGTRVVRARLGCVCPLFHGPHVPALPLPGGWLGAVPGTAYGDGGGPRRRRGGVAALLGVPPLLQPRDVGPRWRGQGSVPPGAALDP